VSSPPGRNRTLPGSLRGVPFDTLRYDAAETGVATIALDQPDTRNALSDAVLDDLTRCARSS